MPEVVQKFIKKEDIVALTPVYQGLLTAYIEDVSKYARTPAMVEVIRHAIESAPFEAGKRIKFEGFGQSHYKSREMGEALRTLERAMLLYLLYPATAAQPPITADKKTMAERAQNLQDTFLNYVRKNKTPLTIFLVNGVKLQGIVSWFDNFCVLLRRDGHSQLVYKHAISTIMPGGPVNLNDQDGEGLGG